MEEVDLLFKGKMWMVVTTRSKIPKKAEYWAEDHLNVALWSYTNVKIFVSHTKKGIKYFAIIKDERDQL